jgi:MFS family permease
VNAVTRQIVIPDGPAGRRRRMLVLLICSSSLFIVYLDSTILNVALPTLQKDLHASLSGLQWIADAYLLVVSSLLMLTGSTADRLGRKRLFLVGLTGFGLSSLLCSLAPDTGSLIGLRMLQGVGGSMLTPISLSIVRQTFHDPRERVQALGIWSGIFGVASACGPIVGGALSPRSAGGPSSGSTCRSAPP